MRHALKLERKTYQKSQNLSHKNLNEKALEELG